MPGQVDKLIVTNFSALQQKYGPAEVNSIRTALDQLVQADHERGLATLVIGVDDAAAMAAAEGAAVMSPTDYQAHKRAIDAVYGHYQPDYLMILGANDVIPHQDLLNPLYAGPDGDDPDQFAWGDIPYACDAPYSQDINSFKGPTRVVGRLPDHNGGSDLRILKQLIANAAGAAPRPASDYDDHLVLSAGVWEASTRQSVSNIFGSDAGLNVVPPATPPWPAAELSRRVHFFNCHGAESDPHFYGQPPGVDDYPVALDSGSLAGQVAQGAVVTFECCYGGELYAPTALQPAAPICNTYLDNGASAVWASTTIAYGPPTGNSQADLMTQYFVIEMRKGASIGRAALQARQSFVRATSPAGPSDLKTLAQFNLYGDPSVTPVQAPDSKVAAFGLAASARLERSDRRLMLARQGDFLQASEPRLVAGNPAVAEAVIDQLAEAAGLGGARLRNVRSFELAVPEAHLMGALLGPKDSSPSGFVTAFVETEPAPKEVPVKRLRLVVGRLSNGELVHATILESR